MYGPPKAGESHRPFGSSQAVLRTHLGLRIRRFELPLQRVVLHLHAVSPEFLQRGEGCGSWLGIVVKDRERQRTAALVPWMADCNRKVTDIDQVAGQNVNRDLLLTDAARFVTLDH